MVRHREKRGFCGFFSVPEDDTGPDRAFSGLATMIFQELKKVARQSGLSLAT